MFSENKFIVHQDVIPLKKNIKLTFSKAKTNWDKHSYLTNSKNRFVKTYQKDQKITAYLKYFDTYSIQKDTISPIIEPFDFKVEEKLTNPKTISFKIYDKGSGISHYEGFLNNQWVLFEYDYKKNLITHQIKLESLTHEKNNLQIIVTDQVGNKTTYDTFFYINEK